MAMDIGIIVTAVNNARNALRSAHSDVDKLGTKGQAAANKLRAIHVVLAGIATAGLAGFAKKVVSTTSDLESLIFRLGILEGGIQGARERFEELTRTFGNVPVALDAIVDGFVRLRAAGQSSTEAMLTMKASVDAVAAFGGGTEELKRLSIGLQQVLGKGVLQMEELRQQIGEAVPSAMRILAREMGISTAELILQVGKGTVDAQTAITKLRIGFEKDFGGIAQAIGGTTIKGALAQFSTNVKKAIADAFIFDSTANVRVAQLIRDAGTAITALIKSIDTSTIEKFHKFLVDVANIAVRVVQALAPLAGVIFSVAAAIASLIANIPANIFTTGVLAAVLIGVGGMGAFGRLIALVGAVAVALSQWGIDVGKLIEQYAGIVAAGGLLFYLIFGSSGIGKILAGIALVGSALQETIDPSREQLIKSLKQTIASEGMIPTPQLGFHFTRSGLVESAKKELEALEKQKTEGEQIFKQRGTSFFEAQKKAYEDAMKRSESAAAPFGLPIVATKAVEDISKLDKAIQIGLQEGAGKKTVARWLQQIDDVNEKFSTTRKRIEDLNAARGTRDWTEKNAAELKELEESMGTIDVRLAQLRASAKSVRNATVGASMEQIDISFRKAAAAVGQLRAEFTGDDLSQVVADLNKKFADVSATVEGVLLRYKKLGDKTGIEATKSLLDQLNDTHKKALEFKKAEHQITQQLFALEQERARVGIAEQMRTLSTEIRNPLSFTSKHEDAADARRAALRQELLDVQSKIGELDKQLANPFMDDAKRADLEKTKSAYAALQEQIGKNIDATTSLALATRDLFESVASSVEGSLKDALKGWIKGTLDAEAVLLAFYDKITDAAIDYLFEIGKIALKQSVLGMMGGGESGGLGGIGFGLLGSLFGAANGGAFRGSIKPFADGGIIGGPTLFGLAGEAGTEAIMPLDNIGGKLGVNARGMGGDNINVHFHGVVDAESFFAKNRSHIIGTIAHARSMNRAGGM
jgi:tape measure domain-containing protein